MAEKTQKNTVTCAQYARRRVAKLEKNALDKALHKSEQTLVKAFRREVVSFLQERQRTFLYCGSYLILLENFLCI